MSPLNIEEIVRFCEKLYDRELNEMIAHTLVDVESIRLCYEGYCLKIDFMYINRIYDTVKEILKVIKHLMSRIRELLYIDSLDLVFSCFNCLQKFVSICYTKLNPVLIRLKQSNVINNEFVDNFLELVHRLLKDINDLETWLKSIFSELNKVENQELLTRYENLKKNIKNWTQDIEDKCSELIKLINDKVCRYVTWFDFDFVKFRIIFKIEVLTQDKKLWDKICNARSEVEKFSDILVRIVEQEVFNDICKDIDIKKLDKKLWKKWKKVQKSQNIFTKLYVLKEIAVKCLGFTRNEKSK